MHPNINKQKNWAVKNVFEPPFYLSMSLISGFVLSSVKMQAHQDQNVPKNSYNSWKNQELALHQTQWRGRISRLQDSFLPLY